MALKICINGFGQIGRLVARIAMTYPAVMIYKFTLISALSLGMSPHNSHFYTLEILFISPNSLPW
jgi:hypothetical protein